MTDVIQIILPGRSNDEVSEGLRQLTEILAISESAQQGRGLLGGEFGYGCEFENAVFSMHPYCWCESAQCPWCAGCWCADNTMRDGPKAATGVECDWCAGVHRWADKGALPPDQPPHYGAPHFWHKASGFRVWWYKYIGRDMQIFGEGSWPSILQDCVASIRTET